MNISSINMCEFLHFLLFCKYAFLLNFDPFNWANTNQIVHSEYLCVFIFHSIFLANIRIFCVHFHIKQKKCVPARECVCMVNCVNVMWNVICDISLNERCSWVSRWSVYGKINIYRNAKDRLKNEVPERKWTNRHKLVYR